MKEHGWDPGDYETTHNAGQGLTFFHFRNFLLRKLGLPVASISGPPYKMVFSRWSSKTKKRIKFFGRQERAMKAAFSKNLLKVEGHRFSNMTVHEQVTITSDAAIFVTVCGGGAMTATFLPKGATLIVYYESKGGRKNNIDTQKPARLDWDMLNHASHLSVHWLPVENAEEASEIDFLVELVRHDLQVLSNSAAANSVTRL